MARSLSWIESSELTDLFRDIGSERDEPKPALGDFASKLTGARPATRSRRQASPPPPPDPTPTPAEQPVGRPAPASRRATMRTDRRAITAAPPPAAVRPAPTPPAPAPTMPAASPAPPAPAVAVTPAAAVAPAAAGAGAPVAGPARPTVEPFSSSPGATLEARIDEYLAWLLDALRLDGAAIVDPNGLVIAARSLDEPDTVVPTGIEPMLRYVGDLFEYDDLVDDRTGNRTGRVDLDDSNVDQEMIHIDGFLALRLGRRHLGVVWTETNFGRFYGLLSLRDTTASEVLEHASDGFRTLFAD